ncbi:efflux RND transporter periplasmic adaptor subunit [Enterococcus faecalis]|uniref:efflux RND transporter periplasmic adaptor subunit n=1 Tax=Enterococcus faecalis TaxID=1351 RepID=UPI001AD7685B|nr:HlyD family efflux transporter periplasmic adaptor subunit [Enterococcus faecalis]MBO6403295.1 RND transporter [Enterococcus faecalis]
MKKSGQKKRNKKVWFGIGAAVVVVGFIGAKTVFSSKEVEPEYTTYTITEMVSLKLDGQVSFLDTRDIFFDPSLGKIAEINVENGKEVKKDSPLLTYNNSDIQATETEQANAVNRNNLQVQQAQENVNLATQKYNEALNKVAAAKQKLNTAKEAEEKETLNAEIQQLNEAVSAANSEVAQANQALQLANSDAVGAANTLEQTRGKVNTVVTAPIDGQVTVDASAMSSTDKPVIKIATQKKNIQGKVTEYDYDKLQTGEEVTVTTVGSGKSAPGKIVSIAQTPIAKNEGNPVVSYQFTVEGDFPWAEGLSTSIAVPQKQMIIPTAAIQKEGEKEFVYVYKAGKAKKTPIETETNLGRKVVKSGLNWKDQVIANPNKELKDNQDVQVAAND